MEENDLIAKQLEWPVPKSREVALFTDLTLYMEALELAVEQNSITVTLLQGELGQRLQKLRLVPQQSPRTVERLMRELRIFNWILPQSSEKTSITMAPHVITNEGREALDIAHTQPHKFRRLLIIKMQNIYVIPGWLIARLWQINPKGQGEVILPAPSSDWKPSTRAWHDNEWTNMLQEQTLLAVKSAHRVSANAFPIQEKDWLLAVRSAWGRLSTLKPRQSHEKEGVVYSPRSRLALAMREASITLLFDRIPYGAKSPDFAGGRTPLYMRTFMGWCPRLDALELLFYTDWHPWVNGRLMFPVSAFRSSATTDSSFEPISEIRNPKDEILYLHQPTWNIIRITFLTTLIQVHQRMATKTGTLYVSLLDLRDEVCRQLRVSSLCFDQFLEQALIYLPSNDFPWSVAVETDTLQEQSGGATQLRQPVYLQGVPHTLIGLARLPQKSLTREKI